MPQNLQTQPTPIEPAVQPDGGTPIAAESGDNRLDSRLNQINSLLETVESVSAPDKEPIGQVDDSASADKTTRDFENKLAQVRLGLASSLFTALRCRDSATAAHSVRVALGCSAWALALEMPEEERDALEVAALLHDIGKIGVPDCVLLKPAELNPEEREVIDRHVQFGMEILRSCCDSPAVLELVRCSAAWFDGSHMSADRQGTEIPLGARMLAIVDAFDSMIMPQVYRAASSRDRAVAELCDFAGTQFDPQLVYHFAQLQASDQQKLHYTVARRWLQELDAQHANGLWRQQAIKTSKGSATLAWLYQQKLLENMYDGVIFLDTSLQVMLWNRGAERLTGIDGPSMLQRAFVPSVVDMRDEHGAVIADDNCPVAHAVRSGVQSLRRLIIRSRNGRDLAVDAHMIPVVGPDGVMLGVSLLMHDASGEASLEQRCHNLYEQAIRDPLTQLANRAEFDRVHALFVDAHLERRLPCSLIICDIDHFKLVNDNWGHPAGDEAIRCIAKLLKNSCRPGDLVARYGGEEFVILCADCNNETASIRAEHLRKAFSNLPQPAIGGKSCSASFGVTEIQSGDTAETMLNRADRALLMAKQGGRNRVVQLGGGLVEEPAKARRGWWFWQKPSAGPLVNKWLATNVPLDITLEKLRGFIADHHAEVLGHDGSRVEVLVQPVKNGAVRRRSDRLVPLIIELDFSQEVKRAESPIQIEASQTPTSESPPKKRQRQTRIHVVVRPGKTRDRRQATALGQARNLISSLQSYLMANETTIAPAEGDFKSPATLVASWLD